MNRLLICLTEQKNVKNSDFGTSAIKTAQEIATCLQARPWFAEFRANKYCIGCTSSTIANRTAMELSTYLPDTVSVFGLPNDSSRITKKRDESGIIWFYNQVFELMGKHGAVVTVDPKTFSELESDIKDSFGNFNHNPGPFPSNDRRGQPIAKFFLLEFEDNKLTGLWYPEPIAKKANA